jgi:hypothetical protein
MLPWRAVRAELVGPGRLVIEAEATEAETRGSFTLKVWGEDGTRTITLTGVVFPQAGRRLLCLKMLGQHEWGRSPTSLTKAAGSSLVAQRYSRWREHPPRPGVMGARGGRSRGSAYREGGSQGE